MTREDVKKIFGENTTEEQITSFLNTYQGEITQSKNLEAELNAEKEKNKTLEGYKKQIDEINKAKLSEEEQMKVMKEEAEKNLKESKVIVNTAKAKEILAGLDIGDDLISSLVSDDEEKTVANATNLKNKMTSFEEAVTKKVTENLLNKDLTPPASNKAPSDEKAMTWEKFEKLSQEEQNKFAVENPEQFANL